MDMLAEKNPNDVLNAFKVQRINEVLEEFRAFVQNEEMKKYLQLLEAPREEMDENGNISQIYIPTLELRIKNPSILIDFYESKIKFS